ncbi:MAG TPA: regulatory protein RecX [Chitinophagaceae bacterium]|nr:regulatory protein RecX [Chitinophagaceae bacterium]
MKEAILFYAMQYSKRLTKEQALQKLRHYCAYQERCHAEVKEKLYSMGLHKQEVEESISQLIEEDYLNEERFALLFAGSKFRIKQWGRVKIKYELKQKKVSAYCIRKAIDILDEGEYLKTLKQLAIKKWKSIKGAGVNYFVKMGKTKNYLLQKGFEPELIQQIINQIKET